MMRLAASPNLPPVLDRVPPAKRAALAAVIQALGHAPCPARPAGDLGGRLHPARGTRCRILASNPIRASRARSRASSSGAGKPIGQLETNAEQFGFFDTLPEKAQRQFLEGVLEDAAKARAQFDAMLKRVVERRRRGDGRTFNRELAEAPALRENLLRKRNANWNRWLQQRLAEPGTVMVAVGAGHLAGGDSVHRDAQAQRP